VKNVKICTMTVLGGQQNKANLMNVKVSKFSFYFPSFLRLFAQDYFECYVFSECECHGHADKCYFDAAVWAASGQTSGGVCIDCQHNTIGTKCEKCKPLHYKDPNLPISDPNVCKRKLVVVDSCVGLRLD
jgi:hypothetical protein